MRCSPILEINISSSSKKTTTPINLQMTLIKFRIKSGSQCQWLTFVRGGGRQLPAVSNSRLRGWAARTSDRTPAAFSLDGGNHSRGEPCPSRTGKEVVTQTESRRFGSAARANACSAGLSSYSIAPDADRGRRDAATSQGRAHGVAARATMRRLAHLKIGLRLTSSQAAAVLAPRATSSETRFSHAPLRGPCHRHPRRPPCPCR